MTRADVRMVQGGRGFGFPLESAEGWRIGGEFVGKELQSDVATELEIFRLVDFSHAASADLLDDSVVAQFNAEA